MKKNSLVKLWLPVIAWGTVIFLFSTIAQKPTDKIYILDFIFKKTDHMIEYFIFSVLWYRALTLSGMNKWKAGVYAILISALYGVSDELHQSFTPGRTPHVRDVGFDTIGATLAVIALWTLLPKAKGRLKTLADKLQLS